MHLTRKEIKMCKLKSAIILKDRIFMPDYDSHSKMLEELGITDNYLGASKKFVRAELLPGNGDVFSDIDGWVFNVDQDITPDWYSEDEYKPKMVEAVKEWAKTRIHIGVEDLKITAGENHYIKDCKNVSVDNSTVTALGNSTVTAYGNSTVKAWGNSTVTAYGNSKVTSWDNSKVTAYGNSTVTALGDSTVAALGDSTVTADGSSTVTAWGNSKVTAWGNSTVKNDPIWSWFEQSSLILCDNATFKDVKEKIIYQSGDYKLVSVESGKKLRDVVMKETTDEKAD